MYGEHDGAGGRRWGAGAATLALHGVVGAGLIWGLSFDPASRPPPTTTSPLTIDFAPPPPPVTPPPPPPPDARPAAGSPPAPEGKQGEALPREAPPAAIPLATTAAAPVAGAGRETNAGSGDEGTGSGAGGSGTGNGSGGEGGGSGSGSGNGLGSPAQRIAGALRDSDYPREAEQARLAGTVGISFRVRTDGTVDRCSVVRSSGAALLDDLTCRLFTQRFRFRPATNARGEPIESTLQTSFTWGMRQRR